MKNQEGYDAACRRRYVMHQRSFPLSSRVSASPEDGDGFVDLDRLAAIGLRRARTVAFARRSASRLGSSICFSRHRFTPPRRASFSMTA